MYVLYYLGGIKTSILKYKNHVHLIIFNRDTKQNNILKYKYIKQFSIMILFKKSQIIIGLGLHDLKYIISHIRVLYSFLYHHQPFIF
jgi:hypothetical protein